MKLSWKVSITLEVKSHLDPPACRSPWIFYRPECVSIGKKKFNSSKVLTLYTVKKLIKNWANINKRVGSENELVTSCSRLKILEIRLLFRFKTSQ